MKDVYLNASRRSQFSEDGIEEGSTVLLDDAVGLKVLKVLFLEVKTGFSGRSNTVLHPGKDHCTFEAILF